MSSPEQIQQEIERTRQSLSAGVDRLSEKVSPGRVVGRRVDSVKHSARSVKEKVMGVNDNATHGVSDAANSMTSAVNAAGSSVTSAATSTKDAVGSAVSHTGDIVGAAPAQVREQTQGNPVAAGVIAFGVGWLISSLLPASQREQQLASKAEDKAQQLAEPLKDAAQTVAGNLQEPLQNAVEQVTTTASDGAHETLDKAKSAAEAIKEPLQEIPAAAQGAPKSGGLAPQY
ncbi:MAG: DUF3618 domain-containing protein [Actinomycetota bacterium]|nr:DUF3618 domain-containing protein [Actinomycetota bacterium]